ncbi:alcohol dehydrogenase catalytic domain-containing protein [Companilactobacillus baiquanensis]|uniref:Alcohol dehydrogenase catalytic domain-containing protein n=1 Tax=Companilactobacillus baiquanensis TaxID=2486005 RepID=A0ABW1UU08_9LACO|nr:zinc-binding dehydrogenase [Companilactobacillus baiquanensis]
MKAAYIDKVGSYQEIKVGELPVPKIDSLEVLVKIDYVSVNHVDTFVRSGGYQTKLSYPFVIGRDAIGVVQDIGSQVDEFKIGDLVWTNSMGYDGRNGVSSEYAAIPVDRLFKAPDVDEKQLIASVHSSATAQILLADILKVKSNKSILIEGSAGHVGTKLLQISKILGLNVATTSNRRDFERLKELGSDQLIDYHQSVTEIGNTFDYIIDTSGKVDLNDNLHLLKLYGQIGMITAPKSDKFSFDVRNFYTNAKSIKGFVISHASLEQLRGAGRALNRCFEKGQLLDDDILELPLSDAGEAHRMLENGLDSGRRVVLDLK